MRALHPRGCGSLLGSAGLVAWHPSALSWVPCRLPVSSRLCVGSGVVGAGGLASGVHGARGLASPGPLGVKAGFFSVASSLCQCCWCSFLFWRQGVFWSHLFIDFQLPKCFVPRLLNQCRLVFLLLGLVFLGRGGGGLVPAVLSHAFGVGVSSRPLHLCGFALVGSCLRH